METQDKELQCVDCQANFILTGGEQEFFASKGYFNPKRCKPCRKIQTAKKNAEKEAALQATKRPLNDSDFE